MKKRILTIMALVTCVVAIVSVIVWGGKISTIEVENVPTEEALLRQKALDCLQTYNGRSYWLLSENDVRLSITKCDEMFIDASVRNIFPGKIIVAVVGLRPIAKVDKGESGCLLARNSTYFTILSADRCVSYDLPLLVGDVFEQNSFSLDFGTSLLIEFSSYGIEATKIEYKGDQVASWYQVSLKGSVTVLIPSGTSMKEKVVTLDAALKGLNSAKERYSTIDLRFDRVVYK